MRVIQKLIKTVYNDFSDEEYSDGGMSTTKPPHITTTWFVLDQDQLDGNKMLNL